MPASSLLPHPHFNSAAVPPEVRALLRVLCADGALTRYAGGVVRDTLLGRLGSDVDFATTLPPAIVIARLTQAGVRVIPTGLTHGTVTAALNENSVEITTLRSDHDTDGRHAAVRFTDSWQEDAQRRDFTINALYADDDGTVHDYVGGLADLLPNPKVRFVGDAESRVKEDYLRILRFYRFAGRYQTGGAALDAAARNACRAQAQGLQRLSGERIGAEMKKILLSPAPAAVLLAMETDTVLSCLGLRAHPGVLVALDAVSPSYLLVALAYGSDLMALAERWRLTHKEKALLLSLSGALTRLADAPSAAAVNQALYDHQDAAVSIAAFKALYETVAQSGLPSLPEAVWQEAAAPAPMPKITESLQQHGLSGAALGKALKKAEKYWISSGFSASTAMLVDHALKSD